MPGKKAVKVREHQLYTVLPSVWKKLKEENHIDPEFRQQARKIEFFHRLFYPAHLLQNKLHFRKIREDICRKCPPVFINGLWRSGTTHLHYMMARDPQFGYLKNHQAFTFNMSLLSMDKLNSILNIFLPKRRPQDNVKITLDDPAEEEQPFATITHRSSIHSFFFPKNQEYFNRYHLFQGISEEERELWKRDYLFLLQNIRYYSRKEQLLLKNPHNTGRIKELLEMFPEAKFIFIHRDPFRVYNSTLKLYDKMIRTQFLQQCSDQEIEQIILQNNKKILQKYLAERSLVPPGNLVEISFEELEKSPIDTVERIYKKINLKGFESAKPAMQEYLDSVKEYKKNPHQAPDVGLVARIRTEWEAWFREWGY